MIRAALLAAALVLVQGDPGPASSHSFSVSSPAGWSADFTADRTVIVRSPGVRNAFDNPSGARVPRGGAAVWIFDYGRPARGDGPTIHLRAPTFHTCGFGYGRMAVFSRGGHLLQAFVKLGPRASRRTLALVLGMLESVRVHEA